MKKFKYIIVFVICLFSLQSWAEVKPVAVISKIIGMAYVNGKPAKVGDELKVGQEIRTRKVKDYLEVKYSKGHIIRLSGAVIKIRAMTEEQSYLQLFKGTIFSVVKKLGKDDKFLIRTRRASFGVRGTKFYIQEDKNQSYLCVCEGTVMAKKEKNEVAVKKDQDLFVADTKPFKTTTSSKQMRVMGTDIFKQMEN